MRTTQYRDGRRPKAHWFLLAIFLLLAALYWVAGLPLRQAREAWRNGKEAEAVASVERWARLQLRPADYGHLLAVLHLTLGRDAQASPHLERLSARRPEFFPFIDKAEVGARLIATGRYDGFLRYDEAVQERGDSDETQLYRTAALAGAGRQKEAEAAFASIEEDEVDAPRYAALRSGIEQRRSGNYPIVVDRNGKTIAAYQAANHDVVAINSDFAPLVEKSAGALTIESKLDGIGTATTLETFLDPFVQKAAIVALGAARGSIVAIDVKTSEILAIASTAGTGPMQNLAMEGSYEPGSVIKVLTALNALESGVSIDQLFPLECGGFVVLNNRQFFDWARHNSVPNLNEALAVSCNIAFAQMGLKLGGERLKSFMQKAGFDGSADLGIYRVPLGTSQSEIHDLEFEVATYAVGLEFQTIHAFHLAMLASMVANQGSLTTPKLVRSRRSILGDTIGVPTVSTSTRIASAANVAIVKEAMKAVATNPRGTGRRAVVAGLPLAMKTGTAGTGAAGYDALIMAFAPADQPRIAIGMIAEHVGPAEIAGAKIAHDFFVQINEWMAKRGK